ncbi:MAG: hypothetical protein JO112_00970 [Planctomycetes bacterium]|nr:hypothetical protein [Planctomycetota bacterium]
MSQPPPPPTEPGDPRENLASTPLPPAHGSSGRRSKRRHRRRWWLIGWTTGFLLLVILVGLGLYFLTPLGQNRYWNWQTLVAVVPLDPSHNPDLKGVSDKCAADIAVQLAKSSEVRAMAPSIVSARDWTEMGPKAAGVALGANVVLAATAEEHDQTVVLKLELIEAETGALLWGKQYTVATQDQGSKNPPSILESLRTGKTPLQDHAQEISQEVEAVLRGRSYPPVDPVLIPTNPPRNGSGGKKEPSQKTENGFLPE